MDDVMKQRFIQQLAEFLVKDQAEMSVRLGMNDRNAQRWAALRGTTPLHGYPTVEEAVQTLSSWLNVPMPTAAAPVRRTKPAKGISIAGGRR